MHRADNVNGVPSLGDSVVVAEDGSMSTLNSVAGALGVAAGEPPHAVKAVASASNGRPIRTRWSVRAAVVHLEGSSIIENPRNA